MSKPDDYESERLQQTENKAVLKELESERLKKAITNSPVTVYGLDCNLRYKWVVNPKVASLEKEMIGKKVGLTGQVMDVKPLVAFYLDVLKAGKSERRELRLDYGNQFSIFDVFADLEKNEKGEVTGLTATSTDITERKKAEELLKETEHRLRIITDNSRDGINLLDLKTGKYVYMNPAQVKLTGFTAEEINNISAKEAYERTYPDDREITVNQQKKVAAGEEDESEPVEYRWKVKSGEYRWFSDNRKLIRDENGQPIAIVGISRDITERKKAEDSSRNTERLLSAVTDGSSDVIYVKDCQSRWLFVNPALERITGKPPSELLGKNDLEIYANPEIGKTMMANDQRVMKSGKAETIEETIETPDGPRHFISEKVPRFDNEGQVIGLIGISRDVTERKKAEENLRKLYRHQRAVSNSNQALMHAVDENLLTQEICDIIVNDCGYALVWVGFAQQDQHKTVCPVAFAGFDKGYIDSLRVTWDENLKSGRGPTGTVIRTGKPYICKNMQIDPNFEPWRSEALKRGYTASLVLPLISFEGETFGVLNIYSKEPDPFTDEEVNLLTELANDFAYGIVMLRLRKKREQDEETLRKQSSLVDLSPDAIIVKKIDDTITFWSQGAQNLYSYTKEEALGKKSQVLLKTKFPEPYEEILNQLKCHGRWSGEKIQQTKFGREIIVDSRWLATCDIQGKIDEILETNVDVTERKQLQNKLEEYATNLEKLVEERTKQLKDSERLAAIGATAGMVGHDIRNPLQAITSDLYLAKTDLASIPESEEKQNIQESLTEIEKNIDYINKIVADLQDFARPLKPNAEETDLKLIIDQLLAKNGLPENVKVSVKVESAARKFVADSTYINRIIYNLVNNAVQAMPKGGDLTIHAFKEAKDVVITVKDTGVGIPDTVKSKLFTPMFTTKSKGQGFGLAVIKRMTEALGGTVSFESQEGKGTTFIVCLPPPPK